MACIEEGGRLSPGNFLLCLQPNWLEIPESEKGQTLHCLQVLKAIYFDGDQCIYVEYDKPRTGKIRLMMRLTHACS